MTWTEKYMMLRYYAFWFKLVGSIVLIITVFILGWRLERRRERAQAEIWERRSKHPYR